MISNIDALNMLRLVLTACAAGAAALLAMSSQWRSAGLLAAGVAVHLAMFALQHRARTRGTDAANA